MEAQVEDRMDNETSRGLARPEDDLADTGVSSADDTYSGRLDIVSDAICPWCYIGKRQL